MAIQQFYIIFSGRHDESFPERYHQGEEMKHGQIEQSEAQITGDEYSSKI